MKQLQNSFPLFLILILFPSLSPLKVQSQTVLLDPPEIYIGPNFGLTASRVLFNPKVQQTYLLGYTGGITFRYVSEEHFGFQVEANYSQRGWNEEGDIYSRRLDYVEVPFLTHAYLGEKNRLFFNVGPKLGYLFNETVLVDDGSNSTAEQHVKPANFKFDYGIIVGLGYNLKTRKAGIYQVEIRGYYGLSDIFANQKTDFFDNSNYLNISANIAWLFQLTGKKKPEINELTK